MIKIVNGHCAECGKSVAWTKANSGKWYIYTCRERMSLSTGEGTGKGWYKKPHYLECAEFVKNAREKINRETQPLWVSFRATRSNQPQARLFRGENPAPEKAFGTGWVAVPEQSRAYVNMQLDTGDTRDIWGFVDSLWKDCGSPGEDVGTYIWEYSQEFLIWLSYFMTGEVLESFRKRPLKSLLTR